MSVRKLGEEVGENGELRGRKIEKNTRNAEKTGRKRPSVIPENRCKKAEKKIVDQPAGHEYQEQLPRNIII